MPDNKDKEISRLTTAEQISSGDLLETAIPAPSGVTSETGYVSRKISLSSLGSYLLNQLQFVTQLRTYAKTIIGAINAIHDSLAQPYDSTSTYSVGSYCIYQGVIYRCIVAINTPEAFTPAHWAATVIANELGGGAITLTSLSDVNIVSPADGDVFVYNATSGKWVSGTIGGINYIDVEGELEEGETVVVLSNSGITSDSTVEVFVDELYYGTSPTQVIVSDGSVTLTFAQQVGNMPVKVRVW